MPKPKRSEIDVEDLIGHIAKKRGVAIHPDDPILLAALINEYCLAQYDDQLQVTFVELVNALTGIISGLEQDREETVAQYRQLASSILKTSISKGHQNINASVDQAIQRIDGIAVGERHKWRNLLLFTLSMTAFNFIALISIILLLVNQNP